MCHETSTGLSREFGAHWLKILGKKLIGVCGSVLRATFCGYKTPVPLPSLTELVEGEEPTIHDYRQLPEKRNNIEPGRVPWKLEVTSQERKTIEVSVP